LLLGVNPHASPQKPQLLNLLAVSFAYPPLAYPRSIQVARLLKFLNASTVLFCCDEVGARTDPTIEPDAAQVLKQCVRVPHLRGRFQQLIDSFAYQFYKPLWNRRNMVPDGYASWKCLVLEEIKKFMGSCDQHPDTIITFAQPFTDHLIGLELKRMYDLPWLAHFSDPWVDNPFNKYDETTRRLNLELERKVVENADSLVFTSKETIDLVMGKYSPKMLSKARVLPQSFDASLFDYTTRIRAQDIVLRHIGNFYGNRTAEPLIKALLSMLATNPTSLDGVRFELIGISNPEIVRNAGGDKLPAGLLALLPSVTYRESLRLMSEADGLLIIDAPADISVFLPSKLIDYIGAGRPVFGITPSGTAAELIKLLGGGIAGPSEPNEIANALCGFIDLLKTRRESGCVDIWGEPGVRTKFEAHQIGQSFEEIIRDAIAFNRARPQ
jgi:glycosyltransferase involved in cell wall biosynthesis